LHDQFFDGLPGYEDILLSPADRRRSLGSGVRRYGYIDKVSDTALEYPQFWPAYTSNPERLKELIREIEVLRNLLVYFETDARIILDQLLEAGNEAFRLANVYYGAVRQAARQQNPQGETLYRMLKLFWKRRRRTTDEPTEMEVERDAKGLLHGTKEGSLLITNESDRVTKGVKTVVDETTSVKQHGGMKVAETEKME